MPLALPVALAYKEGLLMNLKKVRFIFFLIFFVMACGTTGTNFNSGYVEYIKNGETTKDELVKELGEPNRKGRQNKDEWWIYEYNSYKFGKNYSKDLQVIFDGKGVVKAYNFSNNFPGEKAQKN